MKFCRSAILLILSVTRTTNAFTAPSTPAFALKSQGCTAGPVFMSEEETSTERDAVVMETPAAAPEAQGSSTSSSGLSIKDARKLIRKLNADNFRSSLEALEPYLVNDAGTTMYAKSLRRISSTAKEFNLNIPEKYARDAKATAKRREKQDAFIQAKEEERLAAEAEASADDEAEGEDAAPADETAVVAEEEESAAVEEEAPGLLAA